MAAKKSALPKQKPAAAGIALGADFSRLRHARGSAKGLPKLLTALRSAKAGAREEAYEKLDAVLYSDGKFYDAASAACPVLLDLALTAGSADRHRALHLLANVLTAGPFTRLEDGLDLEDGALRAIYETGPAAEIYRMACEAAPRLAALIRDADPRVRANAAQVLGYSFDARKVAAAELSAHVDHEPEALVLATDLVALGMLARYEGSGDLRALLERVASTHSDPFVRGSALLARTYERSGGPKDLPVDALSAFFALGSVDAALFPYHEGDLVAFAAHQFVGLGNHGRIAVREALLEVLGSASQDKGWLGVLLPLCFQPTWDLLLPEDVTPEQRAIIERLSAASLDSTEFAQYGLLGLAESRRRWLGLEPAGVLERRIAVDIPQVRSPAPIWHIISQLTKLGAANHAALAEIAAHLSPEDLATMYRSLADNQYGFGPGTWAAPELAKFLHERRAEALPLARAIVDWALRRQAAIPEERLNLGFGIGPDVNAALSLVAEHGRLPEDAYKALAVQAPFEEVRSVLHALPPARREAIVLSTVDFVDGKELATQLMQSVVEIIGEAPTARVVERVRALRAKYASDPAFVSAADQALERCQH